MAMIWVERRPRSLHLSRNEKYLFWWLGVGGGWGGLGLGVDDVDDDAAECFLVLFCFVCLFVCDIRNCRMFNKNCSIASLFRLDLSVSCHFLHSESTD